MAGGFVSLLALGFSPVSQCLTPWRGFPGGSVVKNPPANAGDRNLIPGLGRSPGGGHGNPLQYSCLGNHGQRSLAGYSPGGSKESDSTEQLSIHITMETVTVIRPLVKKGKFQVCFFGPKVGRLLSVTTWSPGYRVGGHCSGGGFVAKGY